jgi:hypothetical protein
MKVQISLSATSFEKGDRIIAKIAKNEWHTGTVTRAGAKLGLKFDDGATATVDPEDFKLVKKLTTDKVSKKPLTDVQAKPLFAKVKKEKATKDPKPGKKVKVDVSALPSEKQQKTTTVDLDAPNYDDWISKFTKEKAQKQIEKLKAKIEKINAAGMRGARKYEDAGPMDLAWEKAQPLQNQVDLLEFWLKNPKKQPPKEMIAAFNEHQSREQRSKQFKAQRKEAASKFPSLIGKTIQFQSKRGLIEAVVIKQLPGKWSDKPRYKAQEEGRGTWTVSHDLVLKVIDKGTNANLKKINEAADNKKALAKLLKESIGGEITWTSSRLNKSVKGRLTAVGPSKVKATALDSGGDWKIPLNLITHVGGQPLDKGIAGLKPAKPLVESGLFMVYDRQGKPLMNKPGTKAEAEKASMEYLKNNMRPGVMTMTRPVYK